MKNKIATIILLICCLNIGYNSIKNSADTNFQNKKVALIGDSLIAGYKVEKGGLDVFLKQELPEFSFENYSVSGSTITTNTGNDNIVIMNQIDNVTEEPDFIVFNGGVNDVIGYSAGYLNNDLKKEIGKVDTSIVGVSGGDTVITDFEKTVEKIKTKFPSVKLCYIQMCLLDDETINKIIDNNIDKEEIKERKKQFFYELEILCKKWNIEYIDISDKFVNTGTMYRQDDYLHLNESGYIMVSNCLDIFK